MASDDDEEREETNPPPTAATPAEADPELPAPPPALSAAAQQQLQETPSLLLAAKKTPGTWTPGETVLLIEAYQEKWYTLKRGQLRSAHWVEVAEKLASRCRGLDDTTPKSYVQCRHKLEKLRRRYRSERHKSSFSNWPFFQHMDRLERGLPFLNPMDRTMGQGLPFSELEDEDEEEEEEVVVVEEVEEEEEEQQEGGEEEQEQGREEDEDEEEEDSDRPPPLPPPPRVFATRKRRHHYQNPYAPASKNGIKQREAPSKPRASATIDNTSSGAYRYSREPPVSQCSELAILIHSLGENFLRMEHMKIQMQRENEVFRADMELRRTEMVLDLQKQIADLFTQALLSTKKRKKPEC